MINRKKRCDFFYFIAKKFKFRSRAAFKLLEIEKKFQILKKSSGILDLCAAPGSWMQVSRKLTQTYIPVIGVDLYQIRQIYNCVTLKGDITSYFCFNLILKMIKLFDWNIDVVLHDGSPKVETRWISDAYRQNKLVLCAFKFTQTILFYNGWFVTKIFKSECFNNLFFFLKKKFKKIFILKPIASRHKSAEIYIICKNHIFITKYCNLVIKSDFVFNFFESRYNINKLFFLNKFNKKIKKTNKEKKKKAEIFCAIGLYFYNSIIFNCIIKNNFIMKCFIKTFKMLKK